ncbi:MAG: peptide MFS transporter [Gammaproteobacteria bacterium]
MADSLIAELHSRSRQPPGLALLFVTEMWERFSYYGMRALLVLFLIAETERGGFGWPVERASQLYGWYTGLVYLTPLVGGYLADRYLGTHRALVIGGSLIALGHFSLALESVAGFYTGLGLLIAGTGFFKPNVSTMVGQLYETHDPRRDAGFTIFYMGINLGALFGPLVCGYLAQSERFGWGYGFAAAGLGMVLGLLAYLVGKKKYLGEIGSRPATRHADVYGIDPLTAEEKERIAALMITAFFVIFFWLAFEQAGSSMTLFAERSTDRNAPEWLQALIGGSAFPTAWFQAVNPGFILLLAPLFSLLWQRLGRRGIEPSTPFKMALGLMLLGTGFLFLVLGAQLSDQGVRVSPGWLIGAYFLHTCGELCLSPVGLSLVTKLAPLKLASTLMGVWFLATFAANLLGGYLAGALEAVQRGEFFHLLGGQADFFLIFVLTSLAASGLLLALAPFLKKLMHGRG